MRILRTEKFVRRMRTYILHAHSSILNAIPSLRVGRRLDTPVVYEVRAFREDAAVARGTVREGGLHYRMLRGLETWASLKTAARRFVETARYGAAVVARYADVYARLMQQPLQT